MYAAPYDARGSRVDPVTRTTSLLALLTWQRKQRLGKQPGGGDDGAHAACCAAGCCGWIR